MHHRPQLYQHPNPKQLFQDIHWNAVTPNHTQPLRLLLKQGKTYAVKILLCISVEEES